MLLTGLLGLVLAASVGGAPAVAQSSINSAAGTPAPDLAARSLTTKPATLTQGKSFEARVSVLNVGKRKTDTNKIQFLLSRDSVRSNTDQRLVKPQAVRSLRPGKRTTISVSMRMPVSVSGPRYLLACVNKVVEERVTGNNCVALARTVRKLPLEERPENPDASPIEVKPVLEPGRAVTKRVGPAGGTLATTGADGTVYTLVVPASALASEVPITMTPIASLGGSPYAPAMDGVELKPDGLHLANPAMLRITPRALLPKGERSPFAYRSEGTDFVLALYKVVGGSYEMPLLHFTGEGIASGTRIQRTSVANSQPYSFQWQYDNEVANAIANGTADLEDLFAQHFDQHLKPALQWATTAPLDQMHRVKAAIIEFLSHTRQLLMLREDPRPDVQARIDLGKELMGRAVNNMIDKAWSACIDRHEAEHVLTALALTRMAIMTGLVDEETFDPDGKVSRCLRFELEVDGTWVTNPATGVTGYYMYFSVGYQGLIPVEVGGGPSQGGATGYELGGEAPLIVTSQDQVDECRRTPCTPNGGSGLGASFDTPAAVLSFDPDLSVILGRGPGGRPALDPRGNKVTMLYHPGTTTEQWYDGAYSYARDAYEPAFRAVHVAELVPGTASYLIRGWDFVGGEVWARKRYDRHICHTSDEPQYPGGCYQGDRETSSWTMYHRPTR